MSAVFRNNPIDAKSAADEHLRVHPAVAGLVIGGRDVEAGNVSVHLHGKGNVPRLRDGRDCGNFADH